MVFTTKREIREFRKKLPSTGFLPKIYPIGEFFSRLVVVPGKSFVDSTLRTHYLYRAVEQVPIEKLGLSREALKFFKNSRLLTSFFSEVHGERVEWERLEQLDIYEEYREHLQILKQVYDNYKRLLERDGLTDTFLIGPDDYSIPSPLFEGVEEVIFYLKGYLTRFEREVLEKVPVPVKMEFRLTPFNRPLIERMFGEVGEEGEYRFDFHTGKVERYAPLPPAGEVELYFTGSRLEQVDLVFGVLNRMVEEGIAPDRIGVILPDEEFKTFLESWDRAKNLNFAMGRKVEETQFYHRLSSLYRFLATGDEVEGEVAGGLIEEWRDITGWEQLVEWIEEMGERELASIPGFNRGRWREELFKLKKLENWIGERSQLEQLQILLQRIAEVELDDVSGGKVTVMGVLESRGAKLDGVVVVDFNEGKVPKVEEQDYFLNTFTRQMAGLPTQQEKEALQKSYYYDLILNSKKTIFCYVKNDRERMSRFGHLLKLGEPKPNPYRLYPPPPSPTPISYWGIEFNPPSSLTPSSLIDWYECSLRYYFKHIAEIVPPPSEGPRLGILFHAVVAEVLKEYKAGELGLANWEDYFKELDTRISARLDSYSQKVLYWERLLKPVRRFARVDWENIKDKEYRVEEELPKVRVLLGIEGGEVVQMEVESERTRKLMEQKYEQVVSVELGARPDRWDSQTLYDYKTGSWEGLGKKRAEIQNSFYYYLLNQLPADRFPQEVVFIALKNEFHQMVQRLAPTSLSDKIVGLPVVTTPPTNPKKVCKYCPYSTLCLIDHFPPR